MYGSGRQGETAAVVAGLSPNSSRISGNGGVEVMSLYLQRMRSQDIVGHIMSGCAMKARASLIEYKAFDL